ncbi:transglutaminase-like domain-containing protein [Zhongshania sp. BJYM1]|uniref:transglutaminase-like domain-containing protein n=1 Tax=Zhongshania aquatica TaxID=2965069 RepID=UPI0022B2CBE4|nr:transglutaminase-like domain-containing protein [Marortus sp. BJYM1]
MTIAAFTLYGCTNNSALSTQNTNNVIKEQWQTLSFGDHKMGYRHLLSERQGTIINTRDTLSLTLSQPGSHDREIKTTLAYRESLSGEPIALSKTVVSDATNHHMSAAINGKTLRLSIKKGAPVENYTIPQPFYLPEGLRLALLKQQGTVKELNYYSWNFSSRSFDKIHLAISAYSSPDNLDYAWHIQRSTSADGSEKYSDIFADKDFYYLSEQSHSNGEEVLISSCDQTCALASFVPNTHVYRQLIQSPYKITDSALRGKIRYQLSGNFSLTLPDTFEQRTSASSNGVEVVICQNCGSEAPPSETDLKEALASTYWLPAQNPIFKNEVAKILPDMDSSVRGRMQRLTRFVTRHMSDEPSYSGYATALEAYNSKQGDCTEHALLLATLARASQIPTRVVFGLAYSNERFLGRKYVFVPHAWVQAWTGERWESYDSGLGDFTAGYIALGLSNGDQSDILKINEQLQKIKITSAIQIRSR